MTTNQDTIIIDVRTPEEYGEIHIEGSVNLPLGDLMEQVPSALQILKQIDLATRLAVHCASGARSSAACSILKEMGYADVKNIGCYGDACRLAEEKGTRQ